MPVISTCGAGVGFGVKVVSGGEGGVYDGSGVKLASGSGMVATLTVREAGS